MSKTWTATKCIGLLIAGLTLGIVVSLCGMLIVMVVNAWDDAPGGGFFIVLALAAGIIAGVIAGSFCSGTLWKHRENPDQSKLYTALKGSLCFLVGCSLYPAVLILPWTGPHDRFRIALSALVALALATVAGLLVYRGAKVMTYVSVQAQISSGM